MLRAIRLAFPTIFWLSNSLYLAWTRQFLVGIDGVDDYVEVANNTTLELMVDNSFSVEAWIKADDGASTYHNIVNKLMWTDNGLPLGWVLQINTGMKPSLLIADGDGGDRVDLIGSTGLINAGEWYLPCWCG
ncbi:MAG: hypothetical protein QM487_13240 [Candidatus Marithrix sp.]